MMNTENRIGRFKLTQEALRDWRSMLPLFQNMVVVNVQWHWANTLEYTAFSELFEVCPDGCEPPLYEFEFERRLDMPGPIFTKATRVVDRDHEWTPADNANLPA